MTASRINTTKGTCVVALTKHIMQKCGLSQEDAYKHLLSTELYSLLMDDDTRLFLETNAFLCHCCDEELEHGPQAMMRVIEVV